MKLMRKLLDNLGDVWNTLPKAQPMIEIETLKRPNLLGSRGLANNINLWALGGSPPAAVSTAQSKSGGESIKCSTVSVSSIFLADIPVQLSTAKRYIAGCWMYVESYVSGGATISIRDYATSTARYFGAPNLSTIGAWQFVYVKIPLNNTVGTPAGFRFSAGINTAGTMTAYFDELFVYELTAAEYDAIGTTVTGNAVADYIPFTAASAAGPHNMVTVAPGILYLHSATFRSDLPVRQEILLDGLTTQELLDTISSMGYQAKLTSEAALYKLSENKAFTLMEVENVPITTAAKLDVYTSRLWKTMYPIYRVLEEAERDMDMALRQLYRDVASGDWLDFWASFFSISRDPGEGDNDFIRRFTMWLFNPKTNNIALRELLSYTLKDNNFQLEDAGPNTFSVTASVQYLNPDYAAKVHKVLSQAKAAGVEYFLNYAAEPYVEDFRMYWADATGKPYNQNDTGSFMFQKSVAESTWTAPTDLRTDTDMKKSLSETFVAPTDAKSAAIQKPYTESAWSAPVEAVAQALQTIYTESKTLPTELQSMLLQKPAADVYDGFSVANQSNIDSCFTLNDSELRDPAVEMLETRFNGLKDVATMTLTKAGAVVKMYVV